MGLYVAIADSDVDPEAAGKSSLMYRFRDNPLLIASGDEDAPQVVNAALAGYPFDAVAGDVVNVGMALIESWTATAVASKDFTWDESLYTDIMVVFDGVAPATDNQKLNVLFGHTNGTVFYNGSNDYNVAGEYFQFSALSVVVPTQATEADLIGIPAGKNFDEGFSGTATFHGFSSTKGTPSFECVGGVTDLNGVRYHSEMKCLGKDATMASTLLDSIRIAWASGDFQAVGTVKIYGIKRA